jgi:queuosine precursor transporter
MKTLPNAAFAYTPLAMLYTGLLITSSLLLLKPSLYFLGFDIVACCLVLLLFLIYRHFGLKQSLLTLLASALALTIFFLLAKLAVVFPPSTDWPSQIPYALILNFSWSTILSYLFLYLSIACVVLGLFHWACRTHKHETLYYFYPFIGMIFVTILLTCNITTQKIASLLGITVDVGTWFFPFVFIFNNIFTEVYGYASSRVIIWSGLLINILIAFLLSFVALIPATHWPSQDAFVMIAGMTFRIVFASMISYFCSEFSNSYVLAKLKVMTKGRWLFVRTIGSTAVAMVVDSILFTTIAFAGMIPLHLLIMVGIFQYALKVGFEILFTPLTYLVVNYLKHKEQIDYYDIKTNFNPFLIWHRTTE